MAWRWVHFHFWVIYSFKAGTRSHYPKTFLTQSKIMTSLITLHSWLVSFHTSSQWARCLRFKYLASACCSTLQKVSTFPSSTCIDLLWGNFMYVFIHIYIYSTKTKHISIVMYIAMLNSPRVIMTEICLVIMEIIILCSTEECGKHLKWHEHRQMTWHTC